MISRSRNRVPRLRWTITSILTLSSVAAIAAVMALTTWIDIQREQSAYTRSQEESGHFLAETLVQSLADPLYFHDVQRAKVMIQSAQMGATDIANIQIYRPDGSVLLGSGTSDPQTNHRLGVLATEAMRTGRAAIRYHGDFLDIASPIIIEDRLLGSVLLVLPVSDRSQIRGIVWGRIWQGLVFLAVAAVLAFAAARVFNRAFQSLISAAREMGRGNLDEPVPVRGIEETTVLGGTLERMRVELQGLYQGLEQQVAERTKELTDLNWESAMEVAERQKLAEENLVMAEIGKITSSELDIDQIYERLCEQSQRLVPFDRVSINYVDLLEGTVSSEFVSGLELDVPGGFEGVYLKGSITAAALGSLSGELYQPGSLQEVEGDFPMLIPNYRAGLKSFIAVPMVAKAAIAGVLLFQSAAAQAYTQRHLALAVRLASQIAPSVANARLYAQRQQSEAETSAISEIGRIVSSAFDVGDVYHRFTDRLRILIPFDWAFIHTVDQVDGVFTGSFLNGPELPSLRQTERYPLAGSFTGRVVDAHTGVLLALDDSVDTAGSLPTMQPLVNAGARCLLGVPMISGGQIIAVLILASKTAQKYTELELDLANRVAHQVTGAVASSSHLAQRREAEEALRESEEKFRRVMNQAAEPFYLVQRDGKVVDVNESACMALGYSRDELLEMHVGEFSIPLPNEPPISIAESLEARWQDLIQYKNVTVERMHRRKDGATFQVEIRLGLIEFGGNRYRLAMARDITERKRTEEQTESSLREKEVLLKEVNHRVKNNLQIISSLLNLESREALDKSAQKVLQDSQDRIKAMALIHEKLYESEDLSRIDFADYLKSLTAGMHESYGFGSRRVELSIDSSSTYMAIDTAIPCGLIVNELVSNSMKHAFPEERDGYISVALRSKNDRLSLCVRDNGVGLPNDFTVKSSRTLGMRLIDALVEQLNGELKITNEDGAGFEVTFPSGT